MGESDVHHALTKLVASLAERDIPYAIIGAMALNAHGYRRATEDVDVLLSEEGLARFKEDAFSRIQVFKRPDGLHHSRRALYAVAT